MYFSNFFEFFLLAMIRVKNGFIFSKFFYFGYSHHGYYLKSMTQQQYFASSDHVVPETAELGGS